MVMIDMVRGMTLDEAEQIRDRDIYRILEQLPDQKQHCIRLSVKTLLKAIEEYRQSSFDKAMEA
jgi:nitrogen fixation NifU-like protein